MNASKLAASLGISGPTVTHYVDLLLVRRLRPYFANTKKRLVKSPKVYVRDSGLVHALLGIEDHARLVGHPVAGASREGFVVENLLDVAPPGTTASYYGTRAGAQVDLVLELPGQAAPWVIEVKLSLVPRLSRGFYNALEDIKPSRSFVVYSGEDRYPLADDIDVVGLRDMAALLARA